MTSDDVSRITRRLDRDYFLPPGDALLQTVALFAQGRSVLPIPLGLLVDGTVVHGALAGIDVMAARLDEALVDVLQELLPADLAGAVDGLRTTFRDVAESVLRHREQLLDARSSMELSPSTSIDALADEDVEVVFRATAPAAFLVLADAQLHVPTGLRKVGAMRVRVDRIAAWWPLQSEEGVEINYHGAPRPTEEAGQP